MLSDAIRQMRREVDDSSESCAFGLGPDEVRHLLLALDHWAVAAHDMELRLSFIGPHEPILPLDPGKLRIVGGPR